MKFLWSAIVALTVIQGNAYAQKVTYDTVGIGTTSPSTRLQVFNHSRNYYVNKAIPGQTEDSQGINYLLLHEIYTGTLSIDRHVFGKITGIRGNANSFNRKWTVEVNTSSAYNSNTGSLISYNEMTRLVTLTYNSKQYLAIEILNSATLFSFSFTGYAVNEAFQLVTDNLVTAVQAFAANPIGIQGNLSIGTQSAAAKLEVLGGPVWLTNGWQKSIKLYNASAIEFAGSGKSYGLGSSVSGFYLFQANSDGTEAANYLLMADAAGNIGIGTIAPQAEFKLAVNGTIGAKKVKVTQTAWSDFVFHDNYKLPSLMEVENFVKKNKHLPGIPSEAEVVKEGVDVGEMDKLLLQKIEELTLYIIDLKKESARQQEKIDKLEKKLAGD